MRKVILYISLSLDGYIADREGGVDWLGGTDPAYQGDYGYGDFVQGVDTVVMGCRTYEQIITQLSPGEWPYGGMAAYVLTHRRMEDTREVRFYNGPLAALLARLKGEPGRDVWLCGGAELARQAMEDGLVDEYHLTIMPVLLGDGVRLFPQGLPGQRLSLSAVRTENGVVDCIYQKA